MRSIQTLGDATSLSDMRIDADLLNIGNYVGTDNILQNKEGKKDSLYVPTSGKTAAYKSGDILIANIRPYLKKIWFATNDGGSSADVTTLRVKDGFDSKFVYYNLLQDEFFDFAMKGAKGSKMPRLDKSQILDFPIKALDLNTQKSIARTLSLLDNKIALNRKINDKLESLARDLYDYWFVQFEFPDANNRPYKTAGGAMVYNEVLKRKIPAGWKVKNLLDVAEWIGGAQPPKSTFKYEPTDGFIRFIQNRDYADSNHLTYIPIAKSNKICNEYDIMMDKYGDAGRIRFGLAGAYNVALARIKPENQDTQEYLRSFLGSESTYLYLYNACMASTRASLNEEILGNVNIAIPKDYMLERYQKISRDITNQILMIRDENKSLADIRDFLLPILMNGQVTVIA